MSRSIPSTPTTIHARIHEKLTRLYGEQRAPAILEALTEILDSAQTRPADYPLSERDIVLITYGDQLRRDGQAPLQTLAEALRQTLHPTVNTVHILPFYPYSSDDGFSVIDYMAVDPELGSWDDVQTLREDFRLMFDAVFNHISAQSDWFQAFLRGESPYDEFFVTVPPETDLSEVVRPRALPLLTPFQTADGEKHLWTTFSDDQIDLNFSNPEVLLEVIRILLFYVEQGADLIRLDAVAFLWKRIGTSCIHLEETHLIIQLMRDVLDIVAPSVLIITETNVPHEENISYFGDGVNEAQMVYQFPLAPLILHTFRTGDARVLSRWASELDDSGQHTSFFNFTASHDGIGVRPVTGILSDDEINALVKLAGDHGGHVSYKTNSNGTQSPYELNITYFDAITDPAITAESPDIAVKRFIASQAIALSMIGVPGIYFHSLFGSRNNHAGVEQTGRYRTINREKLNADQLLAELDDDKSLRARVYTAYLNLLRLRTAEPAFHPLGHQRIFDLHPGVFAAERISRDEQDRITALISVSETSVTVNPTLEGANRWRDLLTGTEIESGAEIELAPYQIMWLKPV